MKKQLRDIIQVAAARASMATDIITSVLPEVVRTNVKRILAPYLGEPERSAQDAGDCPFGHTAKSTAAPQTDEGKCPVTGQAATPDTSAVKERSAKESAAAAKSVKKKADEPQKKAAAKSPAQAKAKAPKPTVKKAAAKKPVAKKAAPKSAKKKAAPKAAAKKAAPAPVKTSDLTSAQLKKMTVRDELYPIAQELEIRGRKSMNKTKLIEAIQKELGLT